MDLLWKELGHDLPVMRILKCMPSDLFEEPLGGKCGDMVIFNLPPSCAPPLLSAVTLGCGTLRTIRIVLCRLDESEDEDESQDAQIGRSFHRSLSAFIRKLEVVEHFDTPFITASSLVHLGTLRRLQCLNLQEVPTHTIPRSMDRLPSFVHLSKLHVGGQLDIEAVIDLIEMCAESAFTYLFFVLKTCPADGAAAKFYVALARCRHSHSTLRFLGLHYAPPRNQHTLCMHRDHDIAPLFCFRRLRYVDISSPHGFELDDSICARMAQAWQHVRDLVLKENEYILPSRPRATLESLISLARHCPDLKLLQISLDTFVSLPPVTPAIRQMNLTRVRSFDMQFNRGKGGVISIVAWKFGRAQGHSLHNVYIPLRPGHALTLVDGVTVVVLRRAMRLFTATTFLPPDAARPFELDKLGSCLRIPELVDLIFSNLTPSHFRGNRRDLVRLGRTCTKFHGPAMNILWETLDDFMRLLKCMPCDLFTIDYIHPGRKPTVRLLRPMASRDWDRALIYLPRVKIFNFPSFSHFSFAEIIPALGECLPTDCVFPNLLGLRWYPEHEAPFPSIQLFLTSTIMSTDVALIPPSCVEVVLSALSARCPPLKKVEIELDGNAFQDMEDTSRPYFSTFVRQLLVIEDLNMLIPDAASLQHVGRLETLRDLYLPVLPPHVLPRTIELPLLFVDLSRLIIGKLDIESATNLLRRCSSDTVTGAFFLALTQCRRSHTSLRSLGIRNLADDEPHLDQQRFRLRSHRIEHLFCFGNLTELEIQSPCGFELDDDVCREMARAWPHAERLTFEEHYIPRAWPVTLEALRSFAQHCPNLNRLRITLEARTIPRSPPSSGSAQMRLENLHLGRSIISLYLEEMAKFVGSLFPNLIYLEVMKNNLFADEDDIDGFNANQPDYMPWDGLLPGRKNMYNKGIRG
ncbi:hypothetical protein B0H16DRAFT_1697316 [Mycena metata]|uniref:F-box domain-containing protein n=1 Tax=Mycena metata TaxID=1033252 RepID=A0AAD7HWR8_9AGAR|nr:hypothetical protein B0H16DRAFT_1697316 [Mycena metata]